MYRIQFKDIDIVSSECPKRTGLGGVPHLAVCMGPKQERAFNVQAYQPAPPPPEGEERKPGVIATVNGVPVWDEERNDWLREEGEGETDIQWEKFAEEYSPLDESDEDGPELDTVIQEHVDDAVKLANERIGEAESLLKKTAEAAQANEQEATTEIDGLKARVAELEAAAAKTPAAVEGQPDKKPASNAPKKGAKAKPKPAA